MASWEDGAEYAPVERPDAFAMPDADPLPDPAPWHAGTPGPGRQPEHYQPAATNIRLDALVATGTPPRNPNEPFAVAKAIVTDSAWETTHRIGVTPIQPGFDPAAPMLTANPAVSVTDFPPPTPQPGPGPFVQTSADRLTPTLSAQQWIGVAACALLVLGVVVPAMLPLVLLIAAGLLWRALPGQQGVGVASFLTGVVLLAIQWAAYELPEAFVTLGRLAALGIIVGAIVHMIWSARKR